MSRLAVAVAATLALQGAPAHAAYAEAPVSTARVVVPMVFPVVGRVSFTDTFLACRSGCARKHFGQDLMGPKMLPLVAAFDGWVSSLKRESAPGGGNYVTVKGSNGWSANYIHVNNDTPGTDDGRGTARYAFAPAIEVGDRVFAGQLLGYLGDSGNAESTAPHLHFELRRGDAWSGTVYNPYPSLLAARRLAAPARSGPHVHGVLVKSSPGGQVFLLWHGRRRPVRPGVFAARGYSAAQVLLVSTSEERSYPLSTPVPLPDGRVYQAADGSRWVVAGARRHPVADDAALAALRVPASLVRAVDDAALAATPLAVPAADGSLPELGLYREGALVRAAGTKTVHVVRGGARRPVPNLVVSASQGFDLRDVVEVPSFDTEGTPPVGPPVPVRDGLVVANMINRWFVVTGGTRRYVDPAVARVFGYDAIQRLKPGEAAINQLPLGEPLP